VYVKLQCAVFPAFPEINRPWRGVAERLTRPFGGAASKAVLDEILEDSADLAKGKKEDMPFNPSRSRFGSQFLDRSEHTGQNISI